MKILFGMGNRYGGSTMLSRFLRHLNPKHEIKIAAWNRSSYTLSTVDWMLDAISFNLIHQRTQSRVDVFGYKGKVRFNHHMPQFVKDLVDYAPDLVIADSEPFVTYFAHSFDIPLWYCSPNLLLNAWRPNAPFKTMYRSFIFQNQFKINLPPAEKYLVYSPFGDIAFRPPLKEPYEWVRPYYFELDKKEEIYNNMFISHDPDRNETLAKLFNSVDNSVFASYNPDKLPNIKTCELDTDEYVDYLSKSKNIICMGDTNHLSDAFYAGKVINVCPSIDREIITEAGVPNILDMESITNAIMVRHMEIGVDYGKIENMGNFATDELNKEIEVPNRNYLSINRNIKQLHEMIDDI